MSFSDINKLTLDKSKIINENKIQNKTEYYKLTKKPEIMYKNQFINLVDYVSSTKNNSYNFDTCKETINCYLILYPHLKNYYLEFSNICEDIYKTETQFPPESTR